MIPGPPALRSVIVKPLSFRCNLSCSYCFYLEKEELYPSARLMSDAVLDELLGQLLDQCPGQFGITWQGGEPSLAGPAFYRKAMNRLVGLGQGKNKVIGNAFQTNGYRLDPQFIPLFQEYDFLVGLSLDGPQHLHDRYRKNESGMGSFGEVMCSYHLLYQSGIPTNILCSVHAANAGQPDTLYRFYREIGAGWIQFNPVMEWDSTGSLKPFSVDPGEWATFLCRVFDLWYSDYSKGEACPSIRFIENAFHARLGLESPECTWRSSCGEYLVIEANGDIFSCDYFVDDHHRLGNILTISLTDALRGRKQREFGTRKGDYVANCNSCQWKSYCYGGCPKYRDKESGKQVFCESWRAFLEHSRGRMDRLAADYLRNHPPMTFDASGYF